MTNFTQITFRAIILSIILTIILAISNTYLALKIGILASASIPAAMISMGILRFFPRPSIHENNLVQTAASAGEAVAGGIVYTVPALIILHYWSGFSYWENVLIALVGGTLGVLFSVPIRRRLVEDKHLPFPEGKAIAEVLRAGHQDPQSLKQLLIGGLVGAFIEGAQSGLKLLAEKFSYWTYKGHMLLGVSGGFSITLISAGYLIGIRICLSIFIGALIGWGICVPIVSYFYFPPELIHAPITSATISQFWWDHMSFMGVSAMLFGGLSALFMLIYPFFKAFLLNVIYVKQHKRNKFINRGHDIPKFFIWAGIIFSSIILFLLLKHLLPLHALGLSDNSHVYFIFGAVFYLLLIGFFFSAITGYFSGLVGVTASPGAAISIAGLLLTASLIMLFVTPHEARTLLAAEAIVIIMGAIIMGAAAIANDNLQDLKVGYLIGTAPWKQQLMLLLGVAVSALVIPIVMQLLFKAYGIADVLPHSRIDPSQTLAAPPAALMATITKAIFRQQFHWPMLISGALIVGVISLLNRLLPVAKRLSIMGIAIGIYLPLSSSLPLFIGGLISYSVKRNLTKTEDTHSLGTVLACGLMSGSVLMDVLLAIPFSLSANSDFLRILPKEWNEFAIFLSSMMIVAIAIWFHKLKK